MPYPMVDRLRTNLMLYTFIATEPLAVFMLESTHKRRNWALRSSTSGHGSLLSSCSIKTGTRQIMLLEKLNLIAQNDALSKIVPQDG